MIITIVIALILIITSAIIIQSYRGWCRFNNQSNDTKLMMQKFIKKYPKMLKNINPEKFGRINKMFKLIIPILNKHKIQYFADYGTLLGIVRDGYILPWDYDVDFSIFAKNKNEIDNNNFKQALLNVNLTLKRSINNTYKVYFCEDVDDNSKNYYKITAHIDFYVWFDSNSQKNNIVSRGCYLDWSPMTCNEMIIDYKRNLDDILPLKKIYVKQIKSYVSVPNNYIKLLEDTYGKKWRVATYKHTNY
jgi:phosphorylcholine metabolism protein LicD